MANKTFLLKDIAEQLNVTLVGDGGCLIRAVAPLQSACQGDISFLADAKYRNQLKTTKASAVLLSEADASHCSTNSLIAKQPSVVMVELLHLLYPATKIAAGISDTAVVSEHATVDATATISAQAVIEAGAVIGANTVIGAGCYIGEQVKIGANTQLYPNITVLAQAHIGEHVIIHSGAVIGSDGFGNALDANHQWIKVPQLGSVVIGNHVEIGANTTIDRGALGDTIIGKGVRLDNQIQIGHNVQIGDHTAVAGCVGIAGSAVIGKHCMIGGGSCIGGHLTIPDGTLFSGMSMVTKSVDEPGIYSSGTSLMPNKVWRKSVARFKQLDSIVKRLTRLERMSND
ncbi:MAG: UDP-3-O-(3-hydroxymyristoyl)glucosamine N-acyltransferase [Coxiellaceae bacterium]|nr:UDP-3-O-(3-hydroxymyristoyl)glucosamine N-acyltransferase [Coxiellaceae bacterium]